MGRAEQSQTLPGMTNYGSHKELFLQKANCISKLELQSLPLALIFSVSANPWFQASG